MSTGMLVFLLYVGRALARPDGLKPVLHLPNMRAQYLMGTVCEINAADPEAAFAEARATNARAVVLAFQANLGLKHRPNAFEPFVLAVEDEAKQFGKPVLLAHGDGHVYIVDHPLIGVPNVTRLQVPGSPQVGWVRVVVTPDAKFQFTNIVVPAWKYW